MFRWTYAWIFCMARWFHQCYRCMRGEHIMEGCKCKHCGHSEPADHPSHKWEGCRCTVCSTVRDEEHDWNEWGICNKCDTFHPDACVCPDCYGSGEDPAVRAARIASTSSSDMDSGLDCLHLYPEGISCKTCRGNRCVAKLSERVEA